MMVEVISTAPSIQMAGQAKEREAGCQRLFTVRCISDDNLKTSRPGNALGVSPGTAAMPQPMHAHAWLKPDATTFAHGQPCAQENLNSRSLAWPTATLACRPAPSSTLDGWNGLSERNIMWM
jgi:hypothetical protein